MSTYDVAVIGAGVFGSWTAHFLRRAGQSVVLVDAWAPGHSRSSSGDETRIIRMSYGADAIYTRMAHQSLPHWMELARAIGQPIFQPTGVLWLGRTGHPYSDATPATLAALEIPIELLSAADLRLRFPQMHLDDPRAFGILEPESGTLMARRAVAALAQQLARDGMTLATAAIEAPTGSGNLDSIRTGTGDRIHAEAFVFACGPWLPKLFPALLGKRIYPTRQEVFYFASPPGDRRFAPPHFPAWVDFADPRSPYGIPDLEGRGFKLAFDRHGPPFDPDTGDRRVASESVTEALAFLAGRFPALRDAPLSETRVCQYENTSSGDFLIDRHPGFDNLWIVGGGSGHGFKHGPAVGEHTAARVLGLAPAEPRFSLATKLETQNRTVY